MCPLGENLRSASGLVASAAWASTSPAFQRLRAGGPVVNAARVDAIIKYALSVASQNDNFTERELGPIHLIKYVYLAW